MIYGTLDNSGTITIGNSYDVNNCVGATVDIPCMGTEGIVVSLTVNKGDADDPNTWIFHPGTLTNSGAIDIRNSGDSTRGLKNVGTLTNSASGTITVENSGGTSVGIYNRRILLWDKSPKIYTNAILANDGSITVSNSGSYVDVDSDLNGYGVYNVGLFRNSSTGTFTINPSSGSDAAVGLYNSGSITSYGTFTNNRGVYDPASSQPTWGTTNITGTMINYGTTLAGDAQAIGTGTFLNLNVMINLGTITSYGLMYDRSDVGTMINYGTIYNYGGIVNGINHGFCIDEPPYGGGC